MSQVELRKYFESVLVDPAPDTVDVDDVMVAGRGRRHRRRVVQAGCACAATVVTAMSVAWGAGAFDRSESATPVPGTSTVTASSTARAVGTAQDLLGYWHTMTLDGRSVGGVRDGRGDPLMAWFQRRGARLLWGANDWCNDTTGEFTVDSNGRLRLGKAGVTLVGCEPGTVHPRNPQVVQEAAEARFVEEGPDSPARLELWDEGRLLASYVRLPSPKPDAEMALVPTTGTRSAALASQPLAGSLSRGKDSCLRVDDRPAVFPEGTYWSERLGLVVLPGGTAVPMGGRVAGRASQVEASELGGLSVSNRTWCHLDGALVVQEVHPG